MEREIDSLKSLPTEVMRLSFQIANFPNKMEARFDSVDKSLASLDKRFGRVEMVFYGLLAGIVTVFFGAKALLY